MAKIAHLTLDKSGLFALKSTYDKSLVTLIKNMPIDQRAWEPTRKVWLIHGSRHSYILAVLHQLHYNVTDEVDAILEGTVQQTPPGIWLLAGNPSVGRVQTQCPVCWNQQHLCYHTAYADSGGTTHLQFYSESCQHIWELCFQSAFGNLLSWTEVIEWPIPALNNDDDPVDLDLPDQTMADIMDTHRQRLQTFDFDSWLEQAMDDEEA